MSKTERMRVVDDAERLNLIKELGSVLEWINLIGNKRHAAIVEKAIEELRGAVR